MGMTFFNGKILGISLDLGLNNCIFWKNSVGNIPRFSLGMRFGNENFGDVFDCFFEKVIYFLEKFVGKCIKFLNENLLKISNIYKKIKVLKRCGFL